MPRQTHDVLIGYRFTVDHEQGCLDGEELHHLVFQDPAGLHTVTIPITATARAELVRQLTSGVVLANGSSG